MSSVLRGLTLTQASLCRTSTGFSTGGATVDEFLEWFPGVTRAQVEAVPAGYPAIAAPSARKNADAAALAWALASYRYVRYRTTLPPESPTPAITRSSRKAARGR